MKRCIICGNVGDENSTTCEKCGNPFVDMPTDVETVEPVRQTPVEQEEEKIPETREEVQEQISSETPAPVQEEQRVQQAAAPRRRKSGPQIYGQSDMPTEQGQGMVRRNMQGRPQGTPAGRPMNGPQGAPTGRPANGAQGTPTGRPASGAQGAQTGRPANGMQEASSGRPMSGAQGAQTGRPVNGVQGAPSGRSNGMQGTPSGRSNRMQGAPSGRSANGMQGVPTGRPANGTQGASSGRPMNGAQGVPAGRPMNTPKSRPSFNTYEMMETARDAIKSPLFVLVAILNTLYLVSSVAAIFLKELNFSVAARLLSGVELPTQFVGYMDKLLVLMSKLDTDAVAVNLVMRVPDLLFCLGLWLIFAAALSAKETMSGAGFGCVKVVLVINMIKNCVVVLAGLVISVALVVAAWVSGVGGMTVASAVTLVCMIVIAMMVIMYYFCYMATFKTIHLNAGTGEAYGKVSAYVAVMEIVLALSAILNLLSGIVNAEISAITGAVGKMGWMVLFAIWLLSYRNSMSEFEEEA